MNSPNMETKYYSQELKPGIPAGKHFGVWLTHDVDRVSKNLMHALYYGVKSRRPGAHILSLFHKTNPYWNFEKIRALEDKFGARSTFFFLNESIRPKLLDMKSWVLAFGRYNIQGKRLRSVIQKLYANGWEVGLHGSYNSYNNKGLLAKEKADLEAIIGDEIVSSRQHYWNNEVPLTWKIQTEVGLKYDATFVRKNDAGFFDGIYYPFKPFPEGIIVFPTAIMEAYLMNKGRGSMKHAEEIIDQIIDIAIQRKTIMTVSWHQRFINQNEFPEFYTLYEYFLERVKKLNGSFILPSKIKYE